MKIVEGGLYYRLCLFFCSRGFYPYWVRIFNYFILGSDEEAAIFEVFREAKVKILLSEVHVLIEKQEEIAEILLSDNRISEEQKVSIRELLSLLRATEASFKENPSGDIFLIYALNTEISKFEDLLK